MASQRSRRKSSGIAPRLSSSPPEVRPALLEIVSNPTASNESVATAVVQMTDAAEPFEVILQGGARFDPAALRRLVQALEAG